jgi:hypothetical protein
MIDYSKYKTAMKAIGIPLLSIGFVFVIIGFTSFDTGTFEESKGYMIIFGAGGFMTVLGIGLISTSITKPVSRYYATETSPAMKITGESIGRGLGQSGFGRVYAKEIIKVKCPHCGYLEREDANFCSKCGEEI